MKTATCLRGRGCIPVVFYTFATIFFSEKIHQKDKKILCISFLKTFGFKSIKHNWTAPLTAIFTAAPQSEKKPKKILKNAEWG